MVETSQNQKENEEQKNESPTKETAIKKELNFENIEAAKDAKQEMNKILAELREKMSEIDKLTEQIDEKQKDVNPSSPKKTKKLLEEIRVPPLEMLK